MLGERALGRLAARGERRAFEEIYSRYHQELHRYCRAIVGNAQDAHDALQSTMAAAMRALPKHSEAVALRPWLYRVAHNESISILRARRGSTDIEDAPEQTDLPADTRAEDRERLTQLVADLRALPDRHRAALVMRELNDLDYDEIGTALGATPAAARQLVYEARSGLRELELGRDMKCEVVREAISARDGRTLRGRKLRAHLRSCESCQDFRAAITQRGSDLQALTPALGPAAASAVLASILGGSQGGAAGAGAAAGVGGAVATGMGGGLAGSAAVKAASLAAVVALGVGGANVAGVHVPLVGKSDSDSPHTSAPAADSTPSGAHSHGAGVGGQSATHSHGQNQFGQGQGSSRAHGQHRQGHGHGPPAHSNFGGNSSSGTGEGSVVTTTPTSSGSGSGSGSPNLGNSGSTPAGENSQSSGHTGVEHTPPGQSRTPPGQSDSSGSSSGHGSSDSAPGHTGETGNGHGKP
jgi:RNA polymerase sigma factor (sigma-70 family)